MGIYLLVGAAGMAGALLRYYVSIMIEPGWMSGFPLGTFSANMIGSFVLGWFTTCIVALKKMPPPVLKAIGTGLIGSFTTFSTFSVETVELLQQGLWEAAFLYVFLSLAGGMLMAGLGYHVGHLIYRKGKSA
ncbi:MAG TPA: fluoride efflux transporter CrcB [Bacillales bacterium]